MRTFQRVSRYLRPAVGLPILAGLALAGLLVLVLGCGPQKEPAAASAPSLNPRLADVPVPAGFKFKANQSSDRTTGEIRIVRHQYEGDATLRQVAEFYKREMPGLGWTLKEENLTGGRQRLLFEKSNETCHISVWDDWGTKLFIQVYPKGARTAEPAKKAAP